VIDDGALVTSHELLEGPPIAPPRVLDELLVRRRVGGLAVSSMTERSRFHPCASLVPRRTRLPTSTPGEP